MELTLPDGSVIPGPVTRQHMKTFHSRDVALALHNVRVAREKGWPEGNMDGFLHSAQTLSVAMRAK